MRGYCCIGLDNPKTPANVGSIMRAAGGFGVSSVFWSGKRFKGPKCFITDPQKNYKHIPLTHTENLHDIIPIDCVPVAVDLLPEAQSIIEYVHPERAFYIFGAEDNTLGKRITDWCRDVIYVPTANCMNLAAAVNVILYDRYFKQTYKGQNA